MRPSLGVLPLIAAVAAGLRGLVASSVPCYDCEMYNIDNKDRPQSDASYNDAESLKCNYPCQCDTAELRCKSGVSYIRDGCGCCYLCARQEGDICDYRSKCDAPKSLFCDFTKKNGNRADLGFCRAKSGEECDWNGNLYKDGQSFNPSCALNCDCQNGQVICSDICGNEQRKPSIHHCRNAILVQVSGQCCKQWMCPHPQSMKNDNDVFQTTTAETRGDCLKKTSQWSECSKTCGTGVSVRITNDNEMCDELREQRLCLIRPCGFREQDEMNLRRCKHSQRVEFATPLSDDAGCQSVREFRPKYCTQKCHRRQGRCCHPDRTKTLNLEFRCVGGNGASVWRRWMWIKSCKCDAESCID